MRDLSSFADNRYYSQCGEDGIVEEILNRLSAHISLDGWCSEFGAWDGVLSSNTCHFIREKGYKAVLIEGDEGKVRDLRKNFPQEDVHKVHRFVSFEGENSLDSIFAEYEIPTDFDFLSIDVDSVDYYIFESLMNFTPKVICIEFNPTMPNALDFVQAKDMDVKHGCSPRALARLGREKGYTLVAGTHCNLIFVASHLAGHVVDQEKEVEEVNPQGNEPAFLFAGYDGSILSNREGLKLAWHGTEISLHEIQYFPKALRRPMSTYGLLQQLLFALHTAWHKPGQLAKFFKLFIRKLMK